MKQSQKEKIVSILEEIKENSIFVGGGSGFGERREFRDVDIIWNLGIVIKDVIVNSHIPEEEKNENVRKIAVKYDYKILGKNNEWSATSYKWVSNFQDKEYFKKICKFAGFREDETNRFRKGDMRYLISIFTKLGESSISDQKRKKLEKQLEDDSILKLSAEELRELILKSRGKRYTPWQSMRDSLDELQLKVSGITENLETVEDRKKFRDELGTSLISQISAALQLCVITNIDDFNYGYDIVKKEKFKKPKTKKLELLELLNNLQLLLKDFKTKNKLLKKSDYYEYEQLASKLDVLKNEDDFKSFFERKQALSKGFIG